MASCKSGKKKARTALRKCCNVSFQGLSQSRRCRRFFRFRAMSYYSVLRELASRGIAFEMRQGCWILPMTTAALNDNLHFILCRFCRLPEATMVLTPSAGRGRTHAVILGILAFAFFLRVLGQVLVA